MQPLSHKIPTYMVNGPHQIHLKGALMNPGEENDYTIVLSDPDSLLQWWEPSISTDDLLVAITRLDTGERWAWSEKTGVFVDTRKGT